jgi:O-antigen ligase
MWLYIHRPFEIWPILADLRVERVYMVFTIICWMFASKSWTSNRVHLGVAALAVSIFLSTAVSNYTGFETVAIQDWFKILIFYVMLVSSVREEKELKQIIVAFVVIVAIYELHSLREYLSGRGVYRMGTWRMIGVDSSLGDPNSFAASVNYAIPMLLPTYYLANRGWQKLALGGILALAVTCILLTGSRTGFAALLCLVCCVTLASRFRWKVLPPLIIGLAIVWNALPETLQNRYLTLIDPTRGPHNAQTSADSRKEFFKIAVTIWRENPILGVGPFGFPRASGTEMQAHTLYGQALSELGAVGAIAIFTLIGGLFWNFLNGRNHVASMPNAKPGSFCYGVLLATVVAILQLLFLGLGGHNLFRYTWLWYSAFSALALRFLTEQLEKQTDSEGPTDPTPLERLTRWTQEA